MALWFKSEIGSFIQFWARSSYAFGDYQYFKIQTSYFVANLLINIFGRWYSSEPVQVKPMISGNRVVFEDMKVSLGFSFPHGKTGKTEFCQKGQHSPLNPEFQEYLSS